MSLSLVYFLHKARNLAYFHVVLTSSDLREMSKNWDARAKLLFCFSQVRRSIGRNIVLT